MTRRSLLPAAAGLLAALALVTPISAQGGAKKSVFEGDARLDKPISIQWKKQTLYEALQEIEKATSVKLTVDRPLVDEPVMAVMTNVPARKALEETARLLRFSWSRSTGANKKLVYHLFQDKVSRDEEEAIINLERRRMLQAIQEEIERHLRIARMSPDQLQKEQNRVEEELTKQLAGGIQNLSASGSNVRTMQQSMAVWAVSNPVGRTMVEMLDGLTPRMWNQLVDEETVVFSSRPGLEELPLPPAVTDRLRGSSPGFPFPKSFLRSLGGGAAEQGITQVEQMMQQGWTKGDGYRITMELSINTGGQSMAMLRVSPEPLGGDMPSQIYAIAGVNLFAAPTLTEEPKEDPAARAARLAADPVLGRKARITLPKVEKADAISQLLGGTRRSADLAIIVARAFDIPILADAYNRQAVLQGVLPPEGEVPLFKALDAIGGLTRVWDYDNGLICFKSKTWAMDRRSEIPARYMQRWNAHRMQKGGFNLDDLAEIAATLTDLQVEGLMFSALEGGAQDFSDFILISSNRDILRFYGKLIPGQRRALLGGRKIPVRSLFPYQQALLLKIGKRKSAGLFGMAMGSKPKRSAQDWAGAVLEVELMEPNRRPMPGNPGEEFLPAGGSRIYTIRFRFANEQKDEYVIPLSKQGAAGAVAPEAPVAPAPAAPELKPPQ